MLWYWFGFLCWFCWVFEFWVDCVWVIRLSTDFGFCYFVDECGCCVLLMIVVLLLCLCLFDGCLLIVSFV